MSHLSEHVDDHRLVASLLTVVNSRSTEPIGLRLIRLADITTAPLNFRKRLANVVWCKGPLGARAEPGNRSPTGDPPCLA